MGGKTAGGWRRHGVALAAAVGMVASMGTAPSPRDGGGGSTRPACAAGPDSAYRCFTYDLPATRPFVALGGFLQGGPGSPAGRRLVAAADATLGGHPPAGFTARHLVFAFRLTGDTRYLDGAAAAVDQAVARTEAALVAGGSYREAADAIEGLALTYDNAFDRLTPEQRRRWPAFAEQALFNLWHPGQASWEGVAHPWSGWEAGDAGNDGHFASVRATMVWALASQNRTWIDFLQARQLAPLVDAQAALPGGGTREGTGRGPALGTLFGGYLYWTATTGEDLASLTPHVRETVDYWVHATVPTLDRFAPVGDLPRGPDLRLTDAHETLVREAVALSAGSAEARHGTWWLRHNVVQGDGSVSALVEELLPEADAPEPPADLAYHAPGAGVLFARTSWKKDASWIAFVAGAYDRPQQHQEQGAFAFFERDWLSVTSNAWSRSGVHQGVDVNNVIRFERPDGSVVGQNAGDLASTMTPSSTAGVTTVTADLANAYSDNRDVVQGWTRMLELSGDTLRVTDACSVAAGVQPVFQLHVPEAPVVQPDGSIRAGRLRIVLRSPAGASFVAMDPAEYARGYRVDLRSRSGCAFDVELQADDSPTPPAPAPTQMPVPKATRPPGTAEPHTTAPTSATGAARTDAPEEHDPGRPTADQVRAELAGSGLAPDGLTIVEHREEGAPPDRDVVVWERYFDGIEVLGRPLSVRVGEGRWETRHVTELAGPEPMRAADVISTDAACRTAGADPARVTARLVYWPERGYRALVTPVENASDVEKVINGYRLAVEVNDPAKGLLTWVDAYGGGVLDAANLFVEDVEQATGRFYGHVKLDVTPVPGQRSLLKDPVRFSRLDSDGTPLNGQGPVKGPTVDVNQRMTFWDTGANPSLIDAAFALKQSWDFFGLAFARTGLRNLPPGPASTANEAVLYLKPDTDEYTLRISTDTGVIEAPLSNLAWPSLITLERIGHEWSHGVFHADVNYEASARHDAQQWGLDEGTADFFGRLIRERGRAVMSADHDCETNPALCGAVIPPLVAIPDSPGAWVWGDENHDVPPSYWRNLCRPSRGGDPADRPRDYWGPDFLGPLDGHITLGPLNRAQCLLSRGMLSVNSNTGDPDLKDVRAPNGFTGLGSNKVAKMWYQALHFLHQEPAPVTYADARQAMLDAAVAFDGKYSAEYKAVEDAFAAVQVGAAADRAGPLVTLDAPFVRSPGPLSVNATDPSGVESVFIYLDGSPGTGSLLGSFTAPTGGTLAGPFAVTMPAGNSGAHALLVVAKDTHKNESNTSLPFTVDNVPPTVSVNDKSVLYSSALSPMRVFGFTAGDDRGLKRARILVDGADTTYPSSVNLGTGSSIVTLGGATSATRALEWVNLLGSAPGPHTVSVEVTDMAGNTAVADLPPWLHDVTPPSLCTLGMTRGSPWQNVSLAASASDAGSSISKVKYLVDGSTVFAEVGITTAPGGTFSKTITTTLDAAGVHTFNAECIDHQGNHATSPVTTAPFGRPPGCGAGASVLGPGDQINWDKVVILVNATSWPAPSTLKLTEVHYDVDGNEVNKQVGLDRGPGALYTGTFTTGPLSAGIHSFRARCIDSIGQSTTSNVVTLSLTPPGPPPQTDVVFPEAEPNNVSQQSNVVSTIYNVIRGTMSSSFDPEWFAIKPLAGKQVCVAGGVTNGASCTSAVDVFISNQGTQVFVGETMLRPSRSAITLGDYVCAWPGSDGFVYVLIGGDGSLCSTIAYDTLVKFQ